jgi:hypothetical protein
LSHTRLDGSEEESNGTQTTKSGNDDFFPVSIRNALYAAFVVPSVAHAPS